MSFCNLFMERPSYFTFNFYVYGGDVLFLVDCVCNFVTVFISNIRGSSYETFGWTVVVRSCHWIRQVAAPCSGVQSDI